MCLGDHRGRRVDFVSIIKFRESEPVLLVRHQECLCSFRWKRARAFTVHKTCHSCLELSRLIRRSGVPRQKETVYAKMLKNPEMPRKCCIVVFTCLPLILEGAIETVGLPHEGRTRSSTIIRRPCQEEDGKHTWYDDSGKTKRITDRNETAVLIGRVVYRPSRRPFDPTTWSSSLKCIFHIVSPRLRLLKAGKMKRCVRVRHPSIKHDF
jgi:hypothetical protein